MAALQQNGLLADALTSLDERVASAFSLNDWQLWARDDQLPPCATESGDAWRVWLILGGRGAGKTRAGAEWVRAKALGIPPVGERQATRIALVGETFADVRRVMIEGVSGLLAVHADDERPQYEASKLQLVWPNGSVAQIFSAESADSLRGPQFDAAWCDELAKWREPEAVWDMLQFGLRLGEHPEIVVTTTPRPIPLLKQIMSDAGTVTTRAATQANALNLAPSFVSEMTRRYAGTALGRQELLGEIVDEQAGSLWRRDWIEGQRVADMPGAQPHRRGGRSAGDGDGQLGCVRDHRRGPRRRRACVHCCGSLAAGARAACVGAGGGAGLSGVRGGSRRGGSEPGRRSRRLGAAADR